MEEPNARGFLPRALSLRSYRFSHRGENPVSGLLPAGGLYSVNRADFDNYLFEQARKAGAVTIENISFSRFTEKKDHLEVTAGEKTFRCSYLVGADGGFSRVARQIGENRYPLGICGFFRFLPDNSIEKDYRETVHLDFEFIPRGVAGVLPKGNHLWVGTYSTGKYNLQHLEKETRRFITSLGLSGRAGPFDGKKISLYRHGARLHCGRVLLTGEAAGLVNPISGEGIKPGIDSAKVAATHLKEALAWETVDFSPYEKAVKKQTGREMQLAGFFTALAYTFPAMAYHGMTRVVADAVKIMNGQLSYGDFLERLKKKIARKIGRGLVD